MSSGVFTGKESSNRIELSRLVQDLLNFGDLGSLWLLGMGVDGWGECGWGWCHTCVHAHTCTHAHGCMVNMIISCKWLPPLGESLGIPYVVIHACVCVHTHVCMCVEAPSHHPHPWGDPQNQSKFNST